MRETPWFLSYHGLSLAGQYVNDEDSSWNDTISELIRNCIFELVLVASRGRLYYLPLTTVNAARDIGMESLLPGSRVSGREDGVALIDFIDPVRWSQVPPVNRILHELKEKFTPVHAGGDWVGLKTAI